MSGVPDWMPSSGELRGALETMRRLAEEDGHAGFIEACDAYEAALDALEIDPRPDNRRRLEKAYAQLHAAHEERVAALTLLAAAEDQPPRRGQP